MSSEVALRPHAREMRSAATDAETVLWFHLRANHFNGFKFKRQQPIGNYIVDFVCFGVRLVIEVDGGQHNGSLPDASRNEWLNSQGFSVLRLWNKEVLQNLEGVLARILEALSPSPQPLQGALPAASGSRFSGEPHAARIPRKTLSRQGRGTLSSSRRASKKDKSDASNISDESSRLASLPPRGGGSEGEGETP